MENKQIYTNCPQCKNACPADQLKCGRGRAFFGVDKSSEGSENHKHHDRSHGNHDHHSHHHGGGHYSKD